MEIELKHYYRFIFKDNSTPSQLCYTVVSTPTIDDEQAISTFEDKFPDYLWRRFEYLHSNKCTDEDKEKNKWKSVFSRYNEKYVE